MASLTFRRGALFAVLLTLALIMLGAFVRLTDAGLGCPDWPGCYGHFTPAHAEQHIAQAVSQQGGEHGPVSLGKAWREMAHRYVASLLGLVILALAVMAWVWRRTLPGGPWLATSLVGIVILQGLFGMWTVTLLLRPIIVTAHLLGGMLTLAVAVWLWRRQVEGIDHQHLNAAKLGHLQAGLVTLRTPAIVALFALCAQIALGGWTSTNYAALACTDLPTCQGRWWPDADFANGFDITRELGKTASGQMLDASALTAIHLTHRIGAILASACLVWLAFLAWRVLATRNLANWLMVGLAGQITLGVANVLLSLPLPVAVAHNGLAGGLLALVVMIKFRASRQLS